MKTFEIEYTTNTEDRHKVTAQAENLTKAYVDFVVKHPRHYIITDMKEGI